MYFVLMSCHTSDFLLSSLDSYLTHACVSSLSAFDPFLKNLVHFHPKNKTPVKKNIREQVEENLQISLH